MKKNRKRTIVIMILLVIVVVAVYLLTQGGGQTQYSQETAATGAMTTYYNFNGKIEADSSVVQTAPTSATVKEVYVTANEVVQKDDRLMRLSDGTIIKADIAGEVTSLNVHADQKVYTGDTLLEIMNMSSLKVTFNVDEYDISAIDIGKQAHVTLDGSGYTFEGPISYLNKKATVDGDLSYYTATISLTGIDLPQNTLPGMQVNVRILNQSVENVVMLKMDALNFTTSNQAYVLMQDGKDVKQVQVEVGMNDGVYVEVTSGLSNGDTVLYVPADTGMDAFSRMGG